MAKKRTNTKTLIVGNDLTGDAILGDGNTVHKTSIDSEGIHQGFQDVSEAIYENSRQSKWDYFQQHALLESESKEIRDTISIAFYSGVAIGASWHYLVPLNALTAPLVVIAITIFLSTLKLIHLGLRYSLVMVGLVGMAFLLLLNFTALAQSWMDINQIAGTLILGAIGAGIGMITGVIQMFWKPLGD